MIQEVTVNNKQNQWPKQLITQAKKRNFITKCKWLVTKDKNKMINKMLLLETLLLKES